MKRLFLFLTNIFLTAFLFSQSWYSGEYWFDRNYSQKVAFSCSNEMSDFNFNASALNPGFHTLNLHLNNSGVWCAPLSYGFYKIDSQFLNNTSSDVTYKCWFDRDYSSIQSGNISNGMIALPTENIEVGLHTLNIAIENAGTQSGVYSYAFYKIDSQFLNNTSSDVTYKCWFDRDYSSIQSGNISNGMIALPTENLEVGLHTLYIAIENAGTQSGLYSYAFYKFANSDLENPNSVALSYSYWFDNDDAHKITGQLQNGLLMLNTDTLSVGDHYLNIQVNNVTPSHLYRVPFYKAPPTFVVSSLTDTLQGYVEGLGEFDSLSVVQISAVANPCYEFVSWNDGNTDNPREFTLTKDTVFTALFEEIEFDTELSATICQGQTYTDNGFNVSEAGVYTQNLTSANGCDSIVTLNLSVNPIYNTELSASICDGEVYNDNGFNVNEAGIYSQTLQALNGCDSIVTLTLSVNPVFNTNLSAFICEGQTYTENGFNVSEAGTYTQSLQSVNGCDSIVTLTLNVNPIIHTELSATICEGSVYNENGFNVSEAGTYTQNLTTANGCDSIVTLTLNINSVLYTSLTETICEGQTYIDNGFNVSEAGVYTQNLTSVNGCDSIVTLNLSVSPIYNTELVASICDGEVYNENGFNVSEAGVYTQTLQTLNGCDSIVTLTLSVNPIFNTNLSTFICEGQTYTENGFNVSEAGTYTQSLQSVNGCDSIVTLTLNVNPIIHTDLSATICEGTVYNDNGFNVSEAGTYTQNLTTANGCDSIVTLTLNINSVLYTSLTETICEGQTYTDNNFNVSEAGVYTQNLTSVNGCDSIVTLNLSVNPIYNTELVASICDGEVYNENGFNVNEAGVYTQTLQALNGCDSIVTLTLSVNPILNTNLSAFICEGQTYSENGFNVSEAGVYTQSLQSVSGCDSIVTLTLNVNPIFHTELSATICEGSVYNDNGFNVSEAGTYTQNLTTANGCDSIVTLTLNINSVLYTSLTETICEGQTYTDNGFNVNEAGVYTQNLTSVNGCDSIVTLNLSVNPIYNTDLVASICDGEVYNDNGFNVNEAGVYTQTLQTLNGCDSIVTLTLSVNPILNTNLSAVICEGETYTENGFNVSEAGVYTQSLQSVNGCDSIVTLTLNVNPIYNTELTATICEGSVYNDNGFNVSEAGTYTQNLTTANGCDSIVTLTLNINSVLYTSLTETICEGQTYTDNGFNVSEAGVYTQNLTSVNGCDSIVTLNLSVNPIYNTELVASICDGEVYDENGFNVNEAGVYSQTLQALNGCDSIVTLTLSVNPIFNTNLSAFICEGQTYTENGFNVSEAGTYTQSLQSVNGCDSIVTLTLNVNPIIHTELSATICEGSVYNDNGFNVSEAGTYTQNLTTANGCDSIVTLTLNINSVLYTSLTETICEGQTYTDNGFNVSEAGVYTQNLTSVNGCDSIVTLNLSVNPIYNTDLVASICDGEVYNDNGFNVSEAGVYTQTLQTLNGCDSIVTLTLSVNPIFNTDLSAFICQGQTYTENGFNVNEAGVYTQSLQSVSGCDSIVTLTLNVNPIIHTELSATICEGSAYNDNGFNVSEAGTYTQNLTTANGCDSIVTLTLTVLPSYNTNLTATICEGSELNISGFNVSEAGVYTQTYTAVNGCDSIVTLTVTELPIIHTDLTLTICEGTSLNFSGFNVSEAGIYTQNLTAVNGCDSIVTLTVSVNPTFDTTINATINSGETYAEFGFNESESGTYVQNLQTVNGCDSTITLNLTVNSSLYDVAELTEITFYPNPTSGKVTFSKEIEKIEVIDNIGKVVMRFFDTNEINIETLPSGAYYLRMTIGDKTIMRKVIKE